MGLGVGGALRSGYDRLRTPAGLQIVALAFVVQLVANVVNDTTAARLSEAGSAGFTVEPGPLVVDLPPGMLGVLSILSIAKASPRPPEAASCRRTPSRRSCRRTTS
jgi:hypothetical protein